jgi:hypothetical protein
MPMSGGNSGRLKNGRDLIGHLYYTDLLLLLMSTFVVLLGFAMQTAASGVREIQRYCYFAGVLYAGLACSLAIVFR